MIYVIGCLFIGGLVSVVAAYFVAKARAKAEVMEYVEHAKAENVAKANKAKSAVAKSADPKSSSVRKKYTRK